jgi:hypothetical protein
MMETADRVFIAAVGIIILFMIFLTADSCRVASKTIKPCPAPFETVYTLDGVICRMPPVTRNITAVYGLGDNDTYICHGQVEIIKGVLE